MKNERLKTLNLRGLDLGASQVWGGVRLIPVLRQHCPGDLRIGKRGYVGADAATCNDGSSYHSYIPHGLIISWDNDGMPIAAFGANLQTAEGRAYGRSTKVLHRMAKRESGNRLRILPLHLAMEGFLSMHFGGPEIAWSEYSQTALSSGLSPRIETSVRGQWIEGLEEALRVFEIHEQQVGVLCFVADAFASAFIVSHPDDYRLLHRTLIEDFFGELLYQYGLMYPRSAEMHVAFPDQNIVSIDCLRQGLKAMRRDWADLGRTMSDGILGRSVQSQRVYRAGPFQLQRFVTDLSLTSENHIGEAIVNPTGGIEYLKTYRLTVAQTRRAYLLSMLAKHDWNLAATASAFGQTVDALVLRLENAGFGYLLKDHVIRAARRG